MFNIWYDYKIILLEKGLDYKHKSIQGKIYFYFIQDQHISYYNFQIFCIMTVKLILSYLLLLRWAMWPIGLLSVIQNMLPEVLLSQKFAMYWYMYMHVLIAYSILQNVSRALMIARRVLPRGSVHFGIHVNNKTRNIYDVK